MTMTYSDIQQARWEAEQQINHANQATREAAELIAGRLQVANISHHTLKRLKNELKQYNIHTGRWK